MRKYFLILMSMLTLSLSACGGGGSSSGGSSSNTFTGTQTITVTIAGQSASEQAAFVMDLSGNTVTIRDEDFTISTTLDANNNFSVASPSISFVVDGITCTGSVVYTGTVSGNNVSGNLSGSFNCGGVTVAVTGTFSATSGSAKQLNKTLVDVIKEGVS